MAASLAEAARKEVGVELQSTLVELLDLTLQGKQAHWNVTGPGFRPLHLQLDEMVDEYRAWTDQVAERMAAIGVAPDGRARTVAEDSPLSELSADALADRQVLELFSERLGAAAARIRPRLEHLGGVDLVSQDLLIEIAEGLEKQLWMVRAQLA
ncbi:MAG: Dps family protein [Acidimicrobiia bacterium]